jgi:DNA primase
MSETGAWDELWAAAKRADMIELAHGLGAGLKKRGSDWIGPCPIGCAREDGFVVNQEKGFLCRPSGAHGDAVDMVEHVLGCAKVDALEFITGKRPGEKDGAGYAPSAQRAGAPVRPSSKPVSIAATTTADALKPVSRP